MAMAQNYEPKKWMVFLLNMIISVGHWYHDLDPYPCYPLESNMACWTMDHLQVIFLARNLHSYRGFSIAKFDYRRVHILNGDFP